MLLGRSYLSMAQHVEADRAKAVAQGTDDRALNLIADALNVVSSGGPGELVARLSILRRNVESWQAHLWGNPDPAAPPEDDGRCGAVDPDDLDACGDCPDCRPAPSGPPLSEVSETLFGIRPHRPVTPGEDARMKTFAEAFPGYCPDGTCGKCGACELRKGEGS
jgi:hypothetical protein